MPTISTTGSKRAFKLWLGGGIGMGIVAGVATSLVAQIMAWAEDWARFGKTVGIASLTMLLQFWFLEYFQEEGDTDGGTYNPRGPSPFKGYPKKDTSPYRLPFAKGVRSTAARATRACGATTTLRTSSASQQCYAYDFGHDHRAADHRVARRHRLDVQREQCRRQRGELATRSSSCTT